MSFPTSRPPCTAANQSTRPIGGTPTRPVQPHLLPFEGEHQLEKLQFALAIALTRGDSQRSIQLREEIARLGENREEPGT
jgi:hypothetical protein